MTTRKKPTLTEKVAAWKAVYDIVNDEINAQAHRELAEFRERYPDAKVSVQTGAGHAALVAVLMAPWNSEED